MEEIVNKYIKFKLKKEIRELILNNLMKELIQWNGGSDQIFNTKTKQYCFRKARQDWNKRKAKHLGNHLYYSFFYTLFKV